MANNKKNRNRKSAPWNDPQDPCEDPSEGWPPSEEEQREMEKFYMDKFMDLESKIDDALTGTGRYILSTACVMCNYRAPKDGFRPHIKRTASQDIPASERILLCPECGAIAPFPNPCEVNPFPVPDWLLDHHD